MRPNECAGSPILRATPGHVLQWYGPNFHTGPAAEVLHDVSHSRSVPLFWEQVLFVWVENILVSLKAGHSRCCGDMDFCCDVVVFLAAVAGELEYLWACLAKATFIIIRWMYTPERPSQNHPESSYWKQRWGPFWKRWSYVRPVFIFGMVSTGSPHKWEDVCTVCVFRRDAGGKSLVDVWVINVSQRREAFRVDGPNSWVFRLYIGLQVRIWTAQLCRISCFLTTKTDMAMRASPKPGVAEGSMRLGRPL